MNIYLCALSACLCLVSSAPGCLTRSRQARDTTPQRQVNTNGPDRNPTSPASAERQEVKYEILSIGCAEKSNSCLVTVYLAEPFYNEKDMTIVAHQLSQQFKDKAFVHAFIFDDKEIAMAHINLQRELAERQLDSRGWYARYDDQEVLLFRPNKKARGKFVRINLKPDKKH